METLKDLCIPLEQPEVEKEGGLGKRYEKGCASLFNKLGDKREDLLKIAQKI